MFVLAHTQSSDGGVRSKPKDGAGSTFPQAMTLRINGIFLSNWGEPLQDIALELLDQSTFRAYRTFVSMSFGVTCLTLSKCSSTISQDLRISALFGYAQRAESL